MLLLLSCSLMQALLNPDTMLIQHKSNQSEKINLSIIRTTRFTTGNRKLDILKETI